MRATKRKGHKVMYEILQRLKGISCVLSLLSFQADTTIFEYQAETMEFLRDGLNSCIIELEDMNME